MCATGMIMMWGGTSSNIPAGWLPCDGRTLDQTQYAALYAAIGTNFGAQPPAGLFYIPDLRGRFVRGQDDGGRVDPDYKSRTDMQNKSLTIGANVGSIQSDAFQNHVHPYTQFPGTSGNIANGTYWAQGPADTGMADIATYKTSTETRPANAYLIYIIKT